MRTTDTTPARRLAALRAAATLLLLVAPMPAPAARRLRMAAIEVAS